MDLSVSSTPKPEFVPAMQRSPWTFSAGLQLCREPTSQTSRYQDNCTSQSASSTTTCAQADAREKPKADRSAPVFVCAGCRQTTDIRDTPLFCPNSEPDDNVEHVLERVLPAIEIKPADNPFVRYRDLLSASWLYTSDEAFVAAIAGLDEAVARVWGHGFATTPAQLLPNTVEATLFAKFEAHSVGGSHKARHLFATMLYLQKKREDGQLDGARELAIASCGNAALAAAIIAAAAKWRLRVFVPVDANPDILRQLTDLGAHVEICRRNGSPGDPCFRAYLRAVAGGALPFCCQGTQNALCIEGGATIGLELAEQLAATGQSLDWLMVQVGGGALARACAAGLQLAQGLGVITHLPRFCTVQTTGGWPLARAYHRIRAHLQGHEPPTTLDEVRQYEHTTPVNAHRWSAARNSIVASRSRWMAPWDTPPESIAHGILDDETYDWLGVVDAMVATGGFPVVADEQQLMHAQRLTAQWRADPADATGAAGLAGVLELTRRGDLKRDARVGILVTAPASR